MVTMTPQRTGTRTRAARVRAGLAGLLAAASALAAGELVAGLLSGARSPVITVGDRVIDLAPSGVKEFAIAVFGTADKTALIVGILLLSAVFGVLVGIAALTRLALGYAGLALFGIVGVAAALAEDVGAGPAIAVHVVAVLAGCVVLRVMFSAPAVAESGGDGRSAQFDRRRFLHHAGVVAGLTLVAGATGRWLQTRTSAITSRIAVMLPPPANPLPPVPPGADLQIDGLAPYLTPNDDFYRIDTALTVPQVSTDNWTLRIGGMVDRPLELTYQDLLARRLVEADITLACVSNEVGGSLVGNARWLGVRLDELLAEAGVQAGATQIVGRSVDGFTVGFPTDVAFDGREALVAVGMNGEPLPLEHGFPARLVVPGLYGYVSATKWLSEIQLTTLEAFDAYWVPRGWAKEAPIKTQSRIDVPRRSATIAPGGTAVAGVAWAPTRGVERVEVQVDDGPWNEARLADGVDVDTWRQWVWEWNAAPGRHTLRVRATDGTGETQTQELADPVPDGATGWHTISVDVGEG